MAARGAKRSLPLISFTDAHQVVSIVVKLGKDLGTTQLFKGWRHQGQCIGILHSDLGYSTIINTWPEPTSLLFHSKETSFSRWYRWDNVALLECFLDVPLHGPLFCEWEWVDFVLWRHCTWEKISSTVKWSMWWPVALTLLNLLVNPW